jgi:uncharacterized membrane-anchored protein YitT (DUF2179 family)
MVELTLNGSNVMRVATIVTTQPEAVAAGILADLERGVTDWTGKGMYTGVERHVLLCAVSRAEVVQLKAIIHEADPRAFVIMGQAQEVLGEGVPVATGDDLSGRCSAGWHPASAQPKRRVANPRYNWGSRTVY